MVDGKVLRTMDGKEMRFPVLLTPQVRCTTGLAGCSAEAVSFAWKRAGHGRD